MDDRNLELAQNIINPSYIKLGHNSIDRRQSIMRQILCQKQLPEKPLDQLTIKYFLDSLALMDSNNFDQKIGVGQRQARIFSSLVAQRHFYMGHGIGRSGDVMANQPKAAGSSLLLQITRFLVVSALKLLNYDFVQDVLLLPLATGMSLSLILLTLAQMQPQKKYVLWPRIDQKTCLKSIQTANLIPIVIELQQQGDCLSCNYIKLQQKIEQIGKQNILTLISTTSCFAPRIPDNAEKIGLMAKKYQINHIINNAYGIWCSKIAHQIKQATKNGEVTAVVQSTDKNFMVPVGGSIIWTSSIQILQKISAKYPGRANSSPIMDLFVTLLSMGKQTITNLKKQRKQNFILMKKEAKIYAEKYKCRLLQTVPNTISMAMKLSLAKIDEDTITKLGSILYSKRVMGHRIVTFGNKSTKIGGLQFQRYGSHSNNYTQLPYITFACAVGTKTEQIYIFFERLQKSWNQVIKKMGNKQKIDFKQIKDQKLQNVPIKLLQNIKQQIKGNIEEQKQTNVKYK